MRERRELPSPKVSRQKQHALAARASLKIVVEPVIHDNLVDIFEGVTRELAQLGELSAQRSKDTAHDALSFGLVFFRKRQFKIAQTHTPQPPVAHIDHLTQPDRKRSRHRTWQRAQNFDE